MILFCQPKPAAPAPKKSTAIHPSTHSGMAAPPPATAAAGAAAHPLV